MQKVKVRSARQIDKMNPVLTDALIRLTRNHNLSIPLVYQYTQDPTNPLKINEVNTIGMIHKVWFDKVRDCYCQLELFAAKADAIEFDGVIDNISAKMIPSKNKADIDAFVIYNREAKKEIKAKHRTNALKRQANKEAMGQKMAKEGSVPLSNNVDVTDMVEISKQLAAEFEKQISEKEESSDGRSED